MTTKRIIHAVESVGISPKAVGAFLYPLVAAVAAAVASWISTGTFNGQEIKIAAGGLILSGLSLFGAYVGKPGAIRG